MKNFRTNLLKGALLLSAILVFSTGTQVEAKAKPKLSSKKITITVGQKKKLKVKNFKKKKKIKWSSKNSKIATVNKKGKVVGKKKGKTTIIAKVDNKKLKCKVVVKKAKSKKSSNKKTNTNKKIKLNKQVKKELPSAKQYRNFNSPDDLAVGKTVNLFDYVYYAARPIKTPSNEVKAKCYKWFSSDSSVVSIDKYGVATPKKEGKVKIYFKYLDRSGEWRESNTRTINVVNAGDVSYTVFYGLNRDWLDMNPEYLKYNIDRYNSPDAFNYLNVRITNNSSSDITVLGRMIKYETGYVNYYTIDRKDVVVKAGETKTIFYKNPGDGVGLFNKTSKICINYKLNGKAYTITYYPQKNYYEYYEGGIIDPSK